MDKVLVPNLYAMQWYNGEVLTDWRERRFLDDKVSYRLGAPRLRLARVKLGRITPQPNFAY